MGKEWTTVGPDSEIKLVGVSAAASTVIVSLCVCVSQGRQGSGAHLPAPRLDFFQKFTFFRKSPTVKKTSWGADTHTRDTWAHTSSRITQNSEEPHKTTTQEPSKLTNTPARPHDRTTARRPNPRPTQQPQPRSRTGTSPFSAERNRADPSLVLQHVSLTSPFLHDAPSPTRCPTRRPADCTLGL